jgi:NAD(P)-dependent dehydrogenase (short-subunit alcohol dehydrogenase family)
MDAFDLSGHVAVVTGGNRGIGLGMARGLAGAGASVAVWARDAERTADAVAELETLGAGAIGVGCDVGDGDSVAAALATTVDVFGRIDSLFANAGTSGAVAFEDMSFEEWRRVLDVNLDGVFRTAQAVTRRLVDQGEGGSLVFVASVAAHLGLPYAPHYTASKGAVLQLARSLAVRLARFGIRANAISPGWVATEMTGELQDDARFAERTLARTPLRRWGTPDDFAGAAVFLASPASSFVTGAELIIDGGFSAA